MSVGASGRKDKKTTFAWNAMIDRVVKNTTNFVTKLIEIWIQKY